MVHLAHFGPARRRILPAALVILAVAGCTSGPPKVILPKKDAGVVHDMASHTDGGSPHDLAVVASKDLAQGGCNGAPPCQTGQACCAGACIDVTSDPANCGNCNTACDTGETCAAGQCGCGMGGNHCTAPQSCCNNVCDDVSADPTNCGTCGTVCMNGDTCNAGTCGGGGGCMPPCLMGEQCVGGVCQPVGLGGNCNPPCVAGQTCFGGLLCVPNQCMPACGMAEICSNGTCYPSCGIGIITACIPPKMCVLNGMFCL